MSEATLGILKKAILLERRGKAFYSHVAQEAKTPSLREFFEGMAQEESQHEKILSEQFQAVQTTGHFTPGKTPHPNTDIAVSRVLTPEIGIRLAAAGFEAAAISASMAMEANAIAMYRQASLDATDPNEKELYEWLSEFEKGHYETLGKMDRALTEAAWNDADFWPF
ncbi:ferritin-like domain-containing protein [Desulfatirhabdium butyrativorans]|uniref:ferritin-like domain-containing protein n=1 Tax=Desulfatirhabdium butyrativorans TaxID=340467 RepID=UPI00146F9466|nr:ferritin family protein [Desulfatirhabdium butyrativorans]